MLTRLVCHVIMYPRSTKTGYRGRNEMATRKQKITHVGPLYTVEYPTIKKTLKFDVSKFSDEVREEAMYHGFDQKYGDAKSGGTPMEKYEMTQRILAAHEAGSWNVEDRVFDISLILAAVARVKEITVTQAKDALAKFGDDDEQIAKAKEWSQNKKVKAAIAAIRAERLAEAAEESDDDDLEIEA